MFTNLELVTFVLMALDVCAKYWYGTYGQTATQSLLSSKTAQYPSHYGSDRTATYKKHIAAALKVCDCVGLIKWFFWSNKGASAPKYASNGCKDVSANVMFGQCTQTGTIKTLPEVPGLLLWCSGHIGVYIGNGYALEARGFAYGVVKTKVSARSWTHWGKHPLITYVDDADIDATNPTLSKGSKGMAVVKLQSLLLADGQALPKYGADGDFGSETEAALTKYQRKYGLPESGVCDSATWAVLLGEVVVPADEGGHEDHGEPDTSDHPVNPYKEPSANVAKGAKGESVRWVQWALINAGYSCGTSGIDGDFGSKTRAAVVDYQSDKKLTADGIVGIKTRTALKAESSDPADDTGTTGENTTGDSVVKIIADLSQHNGLKNSKNDWAKIAANVSLLILRCGVTRTQTAPLGTGIDAEFAYAAKKCAEYGIPFGVYFYGKVKTETEARMEADLAWETASPYNPSFYAYDVEESCLTDGCIKAWADQIRKRGAKKVGMYIGHNYYPQHKATVSAFDFIWIPRYGKNTGNYDPAYKPAYQCDLHQYASVGKLPGLNDGTVDLNRLTGTKSLEWFTKK